MSIVKTIYSAVLQHSGQKPREMLDLERKYIPVIEVSRDSNERTECKVTAKVGKYFDHLNKHNHFI